MRDVAGNVAATNTVWSFSVAAQTSTGPVAVYGFDEATGSVASDLSGNQLHGTVLGATRQPGRFGSSLQFDGVDDWVTVPGNSLLNLSTALTVEAWVYPTALTGWNTVVFKEAAGSATPTPSMRMETGRARAGTCSSRLDEKAHQTRSSRSDSGAISPRPTMACRSGCS